MREIKFRIWDKKVNKMYHTEAPYYQSEYVNLCFSVSGVDEEENWSINAKDLVIMQYTGLKDKNRKEIFEGDIVQFISNDKLLNKTGVVTWDDEGADYNITGKHEGLDTEFECAFGLTDGEYEVFGNIYENESLLNN